MSRFCRLVASNPETPGERLRLEVLEEYGEPEGHVTLVEEAVFAEQVLSPDARHVVTYNLLSITPNLAKWLRDGLDAYLAMVGVR